MGHAPERKKPNSASKLEIMKNTYPVKLCAQCQAYAAKGAKQDHKQDQSGQCESVRCCTKGCGDYAQVVSWLFRSRFRPENLQPDLKGKACSTNLLQL